MNGVRTFFNQVLQSLRQRAPSSLATQTLVSVVLFATLISAWLTELTNAQIGGLIGLLSSHFLLVWLVPTERLPTWGKVVFLACQCVLVVIIQWVFPQALLDYLFLTIVVQAIVLLRPWVWIPLAVVVWAIWSGGVIISSQSLLDWLQSNLALAFPAMCAIIAAIVYARQRRRSEQVQALLQQVQQRYDTMAHRLRDVQQRKILEERHRLSETIAREVYTALARTEVTLTNAIGQAQQNLNRMQGAVGQTRDSAGMAIERLRNAVMILRGNGELATPNTAAPVALPPLAREEMLIGALSSRVLGWVLPPVFLALALAIALVQQGPSMQIFGAFLVFGTALMAMTIIVQRIDHPIWLPACLAGEAIAVAGLALLTQTLPLLLGLLLVVWQIATRLPTVQMLILLGGLPVSLGPLIANRMPASVSMENLAVFAVAAVCVGMPLMLARRQLRRRRRDEQRLAELSHEIERQTEGVTHLAIAAERSRLAREFHDDLGSSLVLINLQLQLADELAQEDPKAALETLETSREQLRKAWQSLLTAADAGLPVDGAILAMSLQQLCKQAQQAGLQIDLQIDGDVTAINPVLACTVYRVVQEGLTNAGKYALGSTVTIAVRASADVLSVTISDTGAVKVPTNQAPVGINGSFGLMGLRERVELLEGGFEAGPLSNGGFRIQVVLPVDETVTTS